jgi:hypothetical protein
MQSPNYAPKLKDALKDKLGGINANIDENDKIKPVSDALNLTKAGVMSDHAKYALDAINSVHSDGVLPKINILSSRAKSYNGLYNYGGNGESKNITISNLCNRPELTIIHEIGHFIDHKGMSLGGKNFLTESSTPLLNNWKSAVLNTDSIKKILSFRKSKDRKYLLDVSEVWARSYAQYIATKSNDYLLLSQVSNVLNNKKYAEIYRFSQWEDDDFKPVIDAIDELFKKLGWI